MKQIFKTRFDRPLKVKMPKTEGLPSRTKQSFKDEVDINRIIKRAQTQGQFPQLLSKNPQYGDFSNAPDYQQALNIVIKAEEQFSALSSTIRDRFDNNPTKFLEFVHNPENKQEMIKLGIAKPDPIVPTQAAPGTQPEGNK